MRGLYEALIQVLIVGLWVAHPLLVWLNWLLGGPLAYVPGVEGTWQYGETLPAGLQSLTNEFVGLPVPAAVAVLGVLCFSVATLAALGLLLNRFLSKVRLPVLLVKGLYLLSLATVCASLVALRSRPAPEAYAGSLPVRATLATQRPASAPSSEAIAPGLTVHFDRNLLGAYGVRAGNGCRAYRAEPAFDQLMVRRDEQRGWWVFDTGSAQLVFRDGDFACINPSYVHVLDAVRPSTGTHLLAIALIALATLMLSAAKRAAARKDSATARFRGFAVVLFSAWSLYPMLPALLTVWF